MKKGYDEGVSLMVADLLLAEAAIFMCGGGHDIDSVDRLRRYR